MGKCVDDLVDDLALQVYKTTQGTMPNIFRIGKILSSWYVQHMTIKAPKATIKKYIFSCNLQSFFQKLNNILHPETSPGIVCMKLSKASSCWCSFFHTLMNSSTAQEANPGLMMTVFHWGAWYSVYRLLICTDWGFIERVWIIENTSWMMSMREEKTRQILAAE